ncbi:MAG TPA: RcnB family protein [Steroidobacteraceae bacterium]
MAQDQAPRRDTDQPNTARPEAGHPEAARPDHAAPNRAAPGPRQPAHRAPSHRTAAAGPPSLGRRPAHRFLSGGGWHRSIRGPAFHYPSGFAYRAWATGAILPSVFLTDAYFYDNYATLGLAPPPAGYRWVRYGPDVLLVDVRSGRIADVVDGVFY